MALGTSYNSDSRNNEFHPSVYSPYKMNNSQGVVDQTCLTYSFWNGNLKISIFPKKNTGKDGQVAFDYNNGITIYLNHTKARILAEEVKKFLSDPETYNNVGVPSKQTIITVSNGKEYNAQSPLIIIRKVDETGNVMSSFAYETKTDYFFSVRGYREGSADFEKVFSDYNNLELQQLVTILEEFYKASTYAHAFATIDAYSRETGYIRNALNQIGSKLGVELGSSGGGRSYSSSSFFNQAPGNGGNSSPATEYAKGSLDELD